MRLTDLVARLPKGCVLVSELVDPGCDIYTVALLTGEDGQPVRSDVLYFGTVDLLPGHIDEEGQFSCVLAAGDDEPPSYAERANIVRLVPGANLFACYNAVQATFIEDQRLTDITRSLVAAHVSNRGLQYMVEEAAVALDRPIVVVDPAYRYAASHLGTLRDDDSPLSRMMSAEIANETLLDEAVAYIRNRRIDSEIARSKGPLTDHNEILGCTTMTSAVMVRGVCIGHVMMIEHGGPFGDIDREVLVRLTDLVGQELQKSEVWGPTSGEMGSFFLANLLGDRNPSAAVTRRRMKALNFRPKAEVYVVCLHAPGEGLTQVQAEHIAAQLRPIRHHSLYTRYHRHLVLLLTRDEGEGLAAYTEPKLREVAALNGLSVGISNRLEDIVNVREGYDQARAALRYGQLVSNAIDDHSIHRYGDLAYVHLIDLGGRRTNLLRMVHPQLLRLAEHDSERSGELMDTLFCFLQVAGSTARASSMLNLHKNTMLYRIKRIKEIVGLELSSGENLFQLQLGFRILMFLGLYVPRTRVEREDLA